LGISAFEEFDFISTPGTDGIIAAIETLNLLDALEKDRSLSRIGKMMTEFPLPPRQSRIIVEAIVRYPDVTEETIIAAAFLSTQSPYVLPPGEETDARKAHHNFRDPNGDFVSYLKLYRSYLDAPQKSKFCEKNYLDEKAMAEIVNVAAQLEEIVSSLGVPVLSGGSMDDYLSCLARGLIQFLCVREGRDMYRSFTADRILIHPGSVMFRESPQYIVAGEIIRTTRMYAMSVSPLSRKVLENLGPDILSAFGNAAPGTEGKPKRARDFTNNIKIGTEVFEIVTVKGKKTVTLPWEKLSKVKDAIPGIDLSLFKGLRGKITVNSVGQEPPVRAKGNKENTAGPFTLLADEKLSLILRLVPSLAIEGAADRSWPRKATYNSREELSALLEQLPLLVTPAVWKNGKKELGFICLFTDGVGNYWFKSSRGFHTALNESLATVETLIDELGDEVDVADKHIVNQCYRRLSDLLG
jgi:HrpA-like RNA helicase